MSAVEKFIKAHPWAVVLGTAVVLFLVGHMYGKKSAADELLTLAKGAAKTGDYNPLLKALGVEPTAANSKTAGAAGEEDQ